MTRSDGVLVPWPCRRRCSWRRLRGAGAGTGGDGELVVAAWDTGQGRDPLETAAAEFEKANAASRSP